MRSADPGDHDVDHAGTVVPQRRPSLVSHHVRQAQPLPLHLREHDAACASTFAVMVMVAPSLPLRWCHGSISVVTLPRRRRGRGA
jgi:hypothetical protein